MPVLRDDFAIRGGPHARTHQLNAATFSPERCGYNPPHTFIEQSRVMVSRYEMKPVLSFFGELSESVKALCMCGHNRSRDLLHLIEGATQIGASPLAGHVRWGLPEFQKVAHNDNIDAIASSPRDLVQEPGKGARPTEIL